MPTARKLPPGACPDHGHPRSGCPIACTLDVLGDKWSLLVLRDLLLDKRRYNEFLESPEGIPTNILAERLRRLVRHGIIERRRYQPHPPRYEYVLTPKGRDLGPVLCAMMKWADRHVARVWKVPPQTAKRLES